MLFRVLGPVEVLDPAGAVLTLGPRKQRTLLAALLARGGDRAATGSLVDVLWEGDPPRSATANVQTYVWELRKRLPRTRSGAPRVARDRDGYRLVLALYRCGRRAEALHTYHELHRILGTEYGIQPGPPVREMHNRILADDPALLADMDPLPLQRGYIP